MHCTIPLIYQVFFKSTGKYDDYTKTIYGKTAKIQIHKRVYQYHIGTKRNNELGNSTTEFKSVTT